MESPSSPTSPPVVITPPKSHLLDRFAAGGIGGISAAIIGHPMDTIKVRMQTGNYLSTIACTRALWQAEGIRGLYRGLSVPIMGTTPVFALSFWGYGVGQSLLWKHTTHLPSPTRIWEITGAGAIAGLATVPVLCPLERVKCVMQVQRRVATEKPPTAASVLRGLYSNGGLRSVYCGLSAISLREVVASAVYFGTYEIVRWTLTAPTDTHPSALATLFAGGLAGVMNWIVAIPVDTLKSNLQVSLDPRREYPQGIRSVWRKMRADGLPASTLFRGLAPALLRAFPANAAAFFGFEQAMKFFSYARS